MGQQEPKQQVESSSSMTDLRKQVEGPRLSLDEVLNALNEASEGREWYGPKPDLLSNALNRALNRKASALAEPVEAGTGQIKICALCETPMKLARGIGYFCPIMGCENRDGLYKLVESREDPPAGEPCRAEIVLKEREDMVSWLNDLNSNWAVLRNTRSFIEGQPKEYWKKFDACMGEAFELQIALMKLATREAGKEGK